MENILFCIVCYKEKFYETVTFQDLVNSFTANATNEKLNIAIYDNTNLQNWNLGDCEKEYPNIEVNYMHDVKNSGISAAYNYFANLAHNNNFEWIVFLDQDTKLPIDFYKIYFAHAEKTEQNILFPKIYGENSLISPSHYYFYRTSVINNLGSKILLKNITAINSGLMIKTDFYLANGGYNNNLRLDFCDHEFIERLNFKNIYADIIDIKLFQNFSSETNDSKKALERYKLYVKDLSVYSKNKNKLMFFLRVDLPHLLKEIYKNRSLQFLTIRLKQML